jgi:hypothetical protein
MSDASMSNRRNRIADALSRDCMRGVFAAVVSDRLVARRRRNGNRRPAASWTFRLGPCLLP